MMRKMVIVKVMMIIILTIRVLGLLNVTANRSTRLTSATNAHRPITSLYCCGFQMQPIYKKAKYKRSPPPVFPLGLNLR